MAIRYEPVEGGMPGEFNAIDDDSGMSYPIYDPDLYDTIERGFPLTAAQEERIQDAAPLPETTPAPAAPDPNLEAATAMPGQPPPVTEDSAKVWESAQALPAAPTVVPGYTPGVPAPPPAPEGTQLTKAKITPSTPGQPYDLAAEEQRNADLLERRLELSERMEAENMIRREQEIELGRQREEDAKREQEAIAKGARYEKELKTVVDREINQDRLRENQGFFGSLLGIVGQTLAVLDNTPEGAFRQFNAMLERRIDRDINAQKELKNSQIDRLTKALGSEKQAELHYRANARKLGTDVLQSKLDQLGVSNKYTDLMNAETERTNQLNAQARALSYGKPGSAEYEFGIPDPKKGTGTGSGLSATREAELTDEDQKFINEWRKANKIDDKEWKTVSDFVLDQSDMKESLKAAEGLLKDEQGNLRGGSLPGFVDKTSLPTWLASEEGIAVQQAISPVIRASIKATSGTAASDAEVDRIVTQIIGDGSYSALKRGLEGLQRQVDAKDRSLRSAYPGSYRGQMELRSRIESRETSASEAKKAQDEALAAAKKAEADKKAKEAANKAPPPNPALKGSSKASNVSGKGSYLFGRGEEKSYKVEEVVKNHGVTGQRDIDNLAASKMPRAMKPDEGTKQERQINNMERARINAARLMKFDSADIEWFDEYYRASLGASKEDGSSADFVRKLDSPTRKKARGTAANTLPWLLDEFEDSQSKKGPLR